MSMVQKNINPHTASNIDRDGVRPTLVQTSPPDGPARAFNMNWRTRQFWLWLLVPPLLNLPLLWAMSSYCFMSCHQVDVSEQEIWMALFKLGLTATFALAAVGCWARMIVRPGQGQDYVIAMIALIGVVLGEVAWTSLVLSSRFQFY